MFAALLVGLGLVVGWLAKDLGGKLLGRTVARSGRIGYVPRDCGFYCESITEGGQRLIGQYYPDDMFVNERAHYLRLAGDLYNDSDVAVLLKNPSVTFWGKNGPVLRSSNPEVKVAGETAAIVTVPAHGRSAISLALPIFREQLDQKYASTIPVLNFEEVNGRKREFRASHTSFHGPIAAWPRKGRFPIVLLDGSDGEAETDAPQLLTEGQASIPVIDDQYRDRAV